MSWKNLQKVTSSSPTATMAISSSRYGQKRHCQEGIRHHNIVKKDLQQRQQQQYHSCNRSFIREQQQQQQQQTLDMKKYSTTQMTLKMKTNYSSFSSFPSSSSSILLSSSSSSSQPPTPPPPPISSNSNKEDYIMDQIHELIKTAKVEDAENFLLNLLQEQNMEIDSSSSSLLSSQKSSLQEQEDNNIIPKRLLITKDHITTIVQAWYKSPHEAERFLKEIHIIYNNTQLESCKPNQYNYNIILQSWLNFIPPSAKRAQALLDYMENELNLNYNVISCNIVLKTWNTIKIAEGAQLLLDKMIMLKQQQQQQQQQQQLTNNNNDNDNNSIIIIDRTSFINVLEAWSKSKSPLAPIHAENILSTMKKDHNIEPTALCYLRVLDCWSNSNRKDAIERAEILYGKLQMLYTTSTTSTTTTDGSEGSVVDEDPTILQAGMCNLLKVYSKIRNAHISEEVLLDFISDYKTNIINVPPTLDMYSIVLSTWSKSKSSRRALRAEKLLYKLIEEYNNNNNNNNDSTTTLTLFPQPDVICYTTVLHCWASSNKPNAAENAEKLLRQMQQSSNKLIQPNLLSYTCVLHAWSRSMDPNAPIYAEQIFHELLSLSNNNNNNNNNDEEQEHQLQLKLQSQSLQPDRLVYGAMITVWGRNCYKNKDAIEKSKHYFLQLKNKYKEISSNDDNGNTTTTTTNLNDVDRHNIQEQQQQRYLPTVVEYTAMIQAYANHVEHYPKDGYDILKSIDILLNELLQQQSDKMPQLKPNTLTYAAILKTVAKSNTLKDKRKRAYKIIDIMKDEGVEVTPYIRGIVSKCCNNTTFSNINSNSSSFQEKQKQRRRKSK